MSSLVSVLLFGSSGLLGLEILQGLIKAGGFRIAVAWREKGEESKEERRFIINKLIKQHNLTEFIIDLAISSEKEIAEDFRSFSAHTVISTLGGPDLETFQKKLILSAQQAGVQRFIPSEFGFQTSLIPSGIFPLFDAKKSIRAALKESSLQYSLFATGIFYEYWLTPFFGVDKETREVVSPYSAEAWVSLTSLPDIARFVAEYLQNPQRAGQEEEILIGGTTVNYRQAFQLLNQSAKAKGGKSWTLLLSSSEELTRAVEENPNNYSAKFQRIVGHQAGIHWATSETWNFQHSKHKAETLADAIDRVITSKKTIKRKNP